MSKQIADEQAYEAGLLAARQQAGTLTRANLVERAGDSLLAYLYLRGLSFRFTPNEVVMPIAHSYTDGFIDEAVRGWRGDGDGGSSRARDGAA